MRVEKRGNIFPIEPIDPSSRLSLNSNHKPQTEKPSRHKSRPTKSSQPTEEEEITGTDTAEISEAAQQALEAYKESLDTEKSDETDHWTR